MSKTKARKWVISFICIVLSVLLLLSATVYIIDPFMQFREKDNAYMLSAWFVSSGLIRNYDYDTLVLGSSMTWNFNMDTFRNEMGVKPLRIGIGGMRPVEMIDLIDVAYESGKADTYILSTDMYVFTISEEDSRYPQYLLKNDLLSRLRYFFSYEVWFRYIPIDIAFMLLDALKIDLPPKFAYSKSIDHLEDCSLDFVYAEDVVLANYNSGKYAVSSVDTENLYQRMVEQIDAFLCQFDYSKGEHIFFFPPYSALYWCDSRNEGYMDAYLLAKQYFVEQASGYGATVYDFQAEDYVMDLNNYKDTTHYSPEINDMIVKSFSEGTHIATVENTAQTQQKLSENIIAFFETRTDIFEK